MTFQCCGGKSETKKSDAPLCVVDANTISSSAIVEPTIDHIFKYIIIGEVSVGKSCLLLQYEDHRFQPIYDLTIGVEFGTKNVRIQDTTVKLQLWDTAGSERFRSITRSYYRGAVGVIMVYDVSRSDSFSKIDEWAEEVKKYNNGNYIMMLVGNKCDIVEKVISTEMGKKKAAQLNASFYETSAKTGENVDKVFDKLTEDVLRDVRSGKIILESETKY
ncbi:GTP-binding protein YPTC4, putative [Entamoeba invadens IP1]|uniref:GTP-binding protein YPTC4, putative n=1 Tax=Entamoeba invadens IP1 TaxID=370355 RepID=A0A0A1UDR3_ENTIV|nr:GTP-binding protein YPTC4, putative [Entamoeba invadens IP1]ELP94734.1 GTP-binding protein YPTC4, putative [Entamoeba invadens IP1]|eukprot:XP_004261505.1 GTP-binding protein YPTC4, putative [Entamoeba invadens IP1]